MIGKWKAASLCCIAALSFSYGEILKAESKAFTFPQISAVAVKKALPQQSFFRHSGLRPNSRAITFSWSFPGNSNELTGTITVYSLLGRVVAKIPVQQHVGSATWRIASTQSRSGLFIARISYSGNFRNLKLMLWN